MDSSHSIQASNPLIWETLIEDVLADGSAPDASAVQVTQVALNTLESLVNQTTPEATKALFDLLTVDRSIDFSTIERHIRVKAKAFNWPPEEELYTLLVTARDLKVTEEHIVPFISKNFHIIKKVFFKVLQNPTKQNEWLITLIPETVALNCTLTDFTDDHFCTLRIYKVKFDTLFVVSPIFLPIRTHNMQLLRKILGAGCSVSPLFTPYANHYLVEFFRDKMQPEMTQSQRTFVCIKELAQLGAVFEIDAPFANDLLVKVMMLDEPMDRDLLPIFENHRLAEKRQNGMTVLRWACEQRLEKNPTMLNLINHLLRYHFSPDDAGDASLNPPLKVLMDQKKAHLVPSFIERYVNLNVVVMGTTTLLHEVLRKCPRVSLERVAPRLNLFILDAEGRAPVDIAYETHNRQFFKQVIEPRCTYKIPQKTSISKDEVAETLDKVFEKNMELEALEAALLYNVPEFTRKIVNKMDLKEFAEILRIVLERHPQINALYLLNHFFVITSLTDFVEPEYHTFLMQVLRLPNFNPVHYLASVAKLIQQNEPAMMNFFARIIPADWKNDHFKNLRDHFEVFMEAIEQKNLTPEVKQELVLELMAMHGLPRIPDKHPIEVIQQLAFEDYLKDYVRKDGSVQCAWDVLIRLGRLKECTPGAVTLLHDARGKINFKLIGH